MLALGVLLLGSLAARMYFPASKTYEYRDIKLVKIISPYSWLMEKDDGIFRADFCQDYPIYKLNPKAGEVLDRIRYEDHGCWSIAKKDLGIWWKKDPDGNIMGDN